MVPSTKSLAIADFLESQHADLLPLIRERTEFLSPEEGLFLAEEWLNGQIEFLRGGANHTYEWTAVFVDRVRDRGGYIHEILTMLRGVRDLMIQFCSGRIDGVSDEDLHRLSFQIEDNYLSQIGEIYSEMERRIASAERRRYRAIAEWMDRAFVLVDSEGAIGLANGLFTGLVGFTEDRLLGQEFVSLCDPETAAEIRRVLRQKRATSTRTFDGALIAVKGARIPVRFWILPLFDEEGLRRGAAIAMTSFDSGMLLADDAFRTKMLEDLAGNLGMGCYTIDESGRVTSANALSRTFVAVGSEDAGAHCCRQHLDENGRCGDCLRKRVFETGVPYRATVRHETVHGELRWVEIACIPARGEQGAVTRVAKFIRDITEHRMLEDQVFRQQRTSFASQLAMTVAHQLRNPLGVMIGFAEMLSHGMPAEQVPTLIDRIMRNGIRCKEIVQNLLEFGRGAPGEHVRSNINDIVRERVMSLYPASVASRITWRLGEPQPPVEGAPEQLAQVFINLIDNALQAATNQVVFESAACDDTVYVKVWDDGPGVPEAIRPRIFEPFFTTRKEEGGIGLGLSLSRSVVQEHRGLLYLDETASPGACFVIQLPAAESEATRQRARQPPEPARPAGHRILIVEDEPDLVFLLTMALQTHGCPADTAATGAQAVELLQTNVYDAIVIDMLLGDELGGRELYQILLRAYPDLAKRSLFITGDTLKYETRRFLNDTQRPVLEKPFMISDFTRTISDILGQELGTGR